jgi:hypothetical protein
MFNKSKSYHHHEHITIKIIGRRSHFLLAQDRAMIDVAYGRQSSIEWVLREKHPQEGNEPIGG